jgi:hypothetical protein
MNPKEATFPKDILSALGGSGFPLQTAVVAALGSFGQFTIEQEVAWQEAGGTHRFLDIVASINHVRICIECKALRGEKLVFLLPHNPPQSETANVWAVYLRRMDDSTRRPIVAYGRSATAPLTSESIYCVSIGKGSGESRLIEREAQPLVRGTEEYAKDRCGKFVGDDSVLCIPVLLTTASLFVAEYDPLSIPLGDGIYEAREEHVRPVPYVRFTKEFTADGAEGTRLRTVIVAQAASLNDLLHGLSAAKVGAGAELSATVYDSMRPESRRHSN